VYGYGLPDGRSRAWDTVVGVGLGGGALAVAAAAVAATRGVAAGSRFFAAGGAVLIAVAAVTVGVRDWTGYQPLTLATWVTLARGGLIAVVAGLVAAAGLDGTGPVAWLPAVLFGAAAALDRVDGWLARTLDAETPLGSRLDIETDALLVLVATVVVVSEGLAPTPVLAVGLGRYLYLAGQTIRRYRGETPSGESRRWLNRLLYVAMVTALWVAMLPVTDAAATRPLVAAVAVPFVLNFVRSWLAAGRPARDTAE